MVELNYASHCVYKIRYHMVFCIKYRKKLLFDKDRIVFFKEVCSEIGKRYWFEFDAIGTDGDHVHVFVGAVPSYAPSNLMQIIKSTVWAATGGIFPKRHRECQSSVPGSLPVQ